MPTQTHAAKNSQAVLEYWFGDLDAGGWPVEPRKRLWFGGAKQDDEEMRRRFGGLIQQAVDGALADWQDEPATTMALIILADQMTRATRRGSADAFAGDAVAVAACEKGLARGDDKRLPPSYLQFYYLPLEHSEDLAAQQRCVALFRQLQQAHPEKPLAEAVRYAVLHHDIIARFGRFPHRNILLGRTSTAAEQAYLQQNNAHHFGQAPTS